MTLVNNCSNKRRCIYAHTKEEQLYHPIAYKTRMCAAYPRCYRSLCPFAHGDAELRNKDVISECESKCTPAEKNPSSSVSVTPTISFSGNNYNTSPNGNVKGVSKKIQNSPINVDKNEENKNIKLLDNVTHKNSFRRTSPATTTITTLTTSSHTGNRANRNATETLDLTTSSAHQPTNNNLINNSNNKDSPKSDTPLTPSAIDGPDISNPNYLLLQQQKSELEQVEVKEEEDVKSLKEDGKRNVQLHLESEAPTLTIDDNEIQNHAHPSNSSLPDPSHFMQPPSSQVPSSSWQQPFHYAPPPPHSVAVSDPNNFIPNSTASHYSHPHGGMMISSPPFFFPYSPMFDQSKSSIAPLDLGMIPPPSNFRGFDPSAAPFQQHNTEEGLQQQQRHPLYIPSHHHRFAPPPPPQQHPLMMMYPGGHLLAPSPAMMPGNVDTLPSAPASNTFNVGGVPDLSKPEQVAVDTQNSNAFPPASLSSETTDSMMNTILTFFKNGGGDRQAASIAANALALFFSSAPPPTSANNNIVSQPESINPAKSINNTDETSEFNTNIDKDNNDAANNDVNSKTNQLSSAAHGESFSNIIQSVSSNNNNNTAASNDNEHKDTLSPLLPNSSSSSYLSSKAISAAAFGDESTPRSNSLTTPLSNNQHSNHMSKAVFGCVGSSSDPRRSSFAAISQAMAADLDISPHASSSSYLAKNHNQSSIPVLDSGAISLPPRANTLPHHSGANNNNFIFNNNNNNIPGSMTSTSNSTTTTMPSASLRLFGSTTGVGSEHQQLVDEVNHIGMGPAASPHSISSLSRSRALLQYPNNINSHSQIAQQQHHMSLQHNLPSSGGLNNNKIYHNHNIAPAAATTSAVNTPLNSTHSLFDLPSNIANLHLIEDLEMFPTPSRLQQQQQQHNNSVSHYSLGQTANMNSHHHHNVFDASPLATFFDETLHHHSEQQQHHHHSLHSGRPNNINHSSLNLNHNKIAFRNHFNEEEDQTTSINGGGTSVETTIHPNASPHSLNYNNSNRNNANPNFMIPNDVNNSLQLTTCSSYGVSPSTNQTLLHNSNNELSGKEVFDLSSSQQDAFANDALIKAAVMPNLSFNARGGGLFDSPLPTPHVSIPNKSPTRTYLHSTSNMNTNGGFGHIGEESPVFPAMPVLSSSSSQSNQYNGLNNDGIDFASNSSSIPSLFTPNAINNTNSNTSRTPHHHSSLPPSIPFSNSFNVSPYPTASSGGGIIPDGTFGGFAVGSNLATPRNNSLNNNNSLLNNSISNGGSNTFGGILSSKHHHHHHMGQLYQHNNSIINSTPPNSHILSSSAAIDHQHHHMNNAASRVMSDFSARLSKTTGAHGRHGLDGFMVNSPSPLPSSLHHHHHQSHLHSLQHLPTQQQDYNNVSAAARNNSQHQHDAVHSYSMDQQQQQNANINSHHISSPCHPIGSTRGTTATTTGNADVIQDGKLDSLNYSGLRELLSPFDGGLHHAHTEASDGVNSHHHLHHQQLLSHRSPHCNQLNSSSFGVHHQQQHLQSANNSTDTRMALHNFCHGNGTFSNPSYHHSAMNSYPIIPGDGGGGVCIVNLDRNRKNIDQKNDDNNDMSNAEENNLLSAVGHLFEEEEPINSKFVDSARVSSSLASGRLMLPTFPNMDLNITKCPSVSSSFTNKDEEEEIGE